MSTKKQKQERANPLVTPGFRRERILQNLEGCNLRRIAPLERDHISFIHEKYGDPIVVDFNLMYPSRTPAEYFGVSIDTLCNYKILVDYNILNPLTRPPVGNAPKFIEENFYLLNLIFQYVHHNGTLNKSKPLKDPQDRAAIMAGRAFYVFGEKENRPKYRHIEYDLGKCIDSDITRCASGIDQTLKELSDREGMPLPYLQELKRVAISLDDSEDKMKKRKGR